MSSFLIFFFNVCVLVPFVVVSFSDVFPPPQDGTNALMAAASNGHLETATKLVKAGAALDKQNSDGHSALMFAYNGRAQVCAATATAAAYTGTRQAPTTLSSRRHPSCTPNANI